MKERHIIFSVPMVQAILEGRKTMTREVIKPQPIQNENGLWCWKYYQWADDTIGLPEAIVGQAPYLVRDRLWVRETWRQWDSGMCGCGSYMCHCPPDGTPVYRATVNPEGDTGVDESYGPWRPSIHMPRWASRITLEVTGVRVERLQDISEEDAVEEGIVQVTQRGGGVVQGSAISGFKYLWDSLNAKRPGAAWDDNPWVWVIEFKMCDNG